MNSAAKLLRFNVSKQIQIATSNMSVFSGGGSIVKLFSHKGKTICRPLSRSRYLFSIWRLVSKENSGFHTSLHRCRSSGNCIFSTQPATLFSEDSTGNRDHCYARMYSSRMPAADDVLEGLDETQVKLMEEECILVDSDDNNIGHASKKVCHLLENINKGMLHRAFSVFLFNKKGELLIQQRSDEKITFPGHFTNTCCSHPLNFEAEIDETRDAIGVKRAAQRKLKHELGIEPEQIPLEDFHFLTRILYKAENVPKDNKWGEHEIDYILFIQQDVDVVPNPNEVKSYRYVTQNELKDIIDSADSKDLLLTPWFKLIVKTFLYQWWNKLDCIDSQVDKETIQRMI